MRGSWSYFATTLHGNGTESMLAEALPLSGVSITEALSGADSLQAQIDPEYTYLEARDGRPVLIPWQTAIYAELDGVIRFGGILRSLKSSGPVLTLDVVGFVGYLEGLPWTNTPHKAYRADPADLMRMVWKYAQQHPLGNLGLAVSEDVHTPARLGVKVMADNEQPKTTKTTKTTSNTETTTTTTTTKSVQLLKDGNIVTTTVLKVVKNKKTGATSTTKSITTKTTKTDRTVRTDYLTDYGQGAKLKTTYSTLSATAKIATLGQHVVEDEPYVLAPYATHDLLATFNELADAGSIDYRERHTWRADRTGIDHTIRLGYPRIGRRRTDIAFMIGANVEQPECELDADDYASEVLVLGAGEGDKMPRGWASNPDAKRLRRVRVVMRKNIGRQTTAQATAAKLSKAFNSFAQDIEQLVVHDHPSAPLGSWEPGDEVFLDGDAGWTGAVGQWVRVMSTTYSPEDSINTAVLSVVRADKV